MKLFAATVLISLALLKEAKGAALKDGKNRPVSKVVALLKDMQAQLQKEQEDDEGTFDKMQCWCDTNDKEKSAAIEQAQALITKLTSDVEEYTATSARLASELKALNEEIVRDQEALATATAIREKERSAFNSEEKDLIESIQALKAAVTVLSKHNTTPAPAEALLSMGVMLRHQLHKYPTLVQHALNPTQRRTVAAFVQEPSDFLGKKPTFKEGYANQSGEIFGVLSNMLDEFNANLSDSQKEEMARQQAFEDLKAAKEAEIAAGQQQVATKEAQRAETEQNLAQAKEDIEDTRNSLSADQRYLMDLKLKCQMTNTEWAQRQKTRQDEISAVSQAVSILSNDDAHDLFARTFNPSLIQTRAAVRNRFGLAGAGRRNKAAEILTAAAKKFQKPELMEVAAEVKLDQFKRVKEALDKMVEQLSKEKADEIKQKDWCVSEFNGNDRNTELKNRDKSDLQTTIQTLEQKIKKLAEEIAVSTEEIAFLNKEVQKASENREKENKEFQTTIKDQKETQKLLGQAIEVLKGFYAKKAALIATKNEPVGPPPPEGFKEYKNQGASNGVITLLETINRDAAEMEKDATVDEADAQSAYETFVKDTNASIEMKQRDIVDRSESKANAEGELTTTKGTLAGTVTELEQLATYASSLHVACDFVVKNFEIRQTARDQEVEALKQAKAILSGMQ